MADDYPIRPVAIEEAAAFGAVGEQAFNSTWPSEQALELELPTLEPDRSLAAFDGKQIVGTAAAFTFQMAVPGGMTAVAGVSWVSVLPTYRRRGILSSMMRRQLADIGDRGESVAALFSSETSIYGRYGYGVASEQLSFTIRRGEGQLITPQAAEVAAADQVRLRVTDPAEPRAELTKVYDSILPSRPGLIARNDRWWDLVVADPEFARNGASPLRCLIAEDDSGPRGYALYSATPHWGTDALPAAVLSVSELQACDPAAAAAIWSDLLTRDLVGEVRARVRPVDDPLLRILADRRRARPTLTDGLWIRLLNVPSALTERRYAGPVDLVIEVTDDLITGNCGRWRLQAPAYPDPARPTCQRTRAAADIWMPVQSLGALYLGGTRTGALVSAGQVTELRPGAARALSTAMTWDPAPWCAAIF